MQTVVTLHSYWRWIVLLVGLVTIARALIGWLGKKPHANLDDQLGQAYTMVLDIQVLLGLFLWVGMGFAATLFSAMSQPELRFFALEHPLSMLLATALAHVGRARSRKADNPTSRHRTEALFYAVSLAAIAAAIPWYLLGR